MKRLFLALLAMMAFVACEKDEEMGGFIIPDNPDIEPGVAENISEYELAFDEEGLCYSKKHEGITEAEFQTKVFGYGWKEITSNRVLENGNLVAEDYVGEYIGESRQHIAFDSEGVTTEFFRTGAFAPEEDKWFRVRHYRYDGAQMFLEGATSATTGASYYYNVLEVTENNLVCLKLREVPREANGWKYVYTLNIYKRMSAEELTEYQQTYTREEK